ncbi:MAG: ribbon-helix-helix protein, CopG family [Rhodanobacteraceae bacterium]|nr:MAG: ribbon-helix-helix protein, CopG family [Rhodanobacteraceae bacterium]
MRLPMTQEAATAPITVRADKDMVSAIDALAGAMDRSRNYVVNQAIQQYLDANAWQVERIKAGIADTRAGRVTPAEEVFAAIGKKHGWKP